MAKRPLDWQMGVEDEILKELRQILEKAARDIEKEISDTPEPANIGDKLQRAQAEAIAKAAKSHLAGDWSSIGSVLSEARKQAARASVASFYDQIGEPLGKLLGKDGLESLVSAESVRAANTINTVMARLSDSRRSLSQQVWSTKAMTNRWLDSKINQALARGWDAKRLAKEVVGFVNPNTPGGASYAAMRLARTEINNAFHSQTIQQMQNSGVVDYVKWNLSRSHPDRDICDDLAEHRLGDPIPGAAPEPDVPDWKPSMTAEEADRWASGSSYKQPFYHGTSRTRANDIKSSGFNLEKAGENTGTDGLYGRGVYLAPSRDVAELYSDLKNPVILEARVNSRNPMRVSQGQPTPGFAEYRVGWMRDNPEIPFEKAVPQALQDYAKSLGHDSIVRIDKDELLEIVLFDKEQVVIVDGSSE